MRLYTIALVSSLALAASANPAGASLLTSFTATPSVIQVGQSATLELLLTPVFNLPLDAFSVGGVTFDSGDGQTVDVFAGGALLAPLDLQYTFTYLTSGTFTPTAVTAVSETYLDSVLGIPAVADYFFTGDQALTARLVVLAPEPATLALFGAGLAGLGALHRRRKATAR